MVQEELEYTIARLNTALTQLGGAFRRARIASQKTLKEVANLSGVSFGYVGRMERGTLPAPPSELALKRMCAAIGIPPEPLIALRSDWYREGSLEPTVIQSSDAARDELAGLGEQALRAADLAQRKRNIDAEIELTHTALDLFDRSGRFSEIGMAAYRLGSAHLSRTWGPLEGPMTGQVLADAKASLLNFDRATSAYSRVPELSIGDTQRMHDGLAQAGRLLERISDLNNASIGADPRIEFTEAQSLLDQGNRPLSTSFLREQIKAAADRLIELNPNDATLVNVEAPVFSRIVDYFTAEGLKIAYKVYAVALLDAAAEGFEHLVQRLWNQPLSLSDELELSLAMKNYANALRDRADLHPEDDEATRNRSRDLFAASAGRLRRLILKAQPFDREPLLSRLQEAHQEIGWLLSAPNDTLEESVWHYHVALTLDPADQFDRHRHITSRLSQLRVAHEHVIDSTLLKIRSQLSDEKIQSLEYPLFFNKGVPSDQVSE